MIYVARRVSVLRACTMGNAPVREEEPGGDSAVQ